MKKILICLSALIIITACKEEAPKDYVSLAGKIENKSSDSLFVYQGKAFTKTIKVNEDGTFSDTLKVATGKYGIYDGKKSTNVFLKNGYDLNITFDTEKLQETIKFSGEGSELNNYLFEKIKLQKNLIQPNILDLKESEFNAKVTEIENKMNAFLEKYANGLDSTFYANEKKEIAQFKPSVTKSFMQKQARKNQFAQFIGKPFTAFNYENVKGGKTSLADLKGKYVYIDVWATWCGPCIREIPSLKEVEKEFHNKNIEFVSISVDNGRGYKATDKKTALELSHEGWKKMIANKSLTGIQLFADKGFQSNFVKDYQIGGIPRFMLIDPAGNVVNADAPRPSNPKLKELLNGLENI